MNKVKIGGVEYYLVFNGMSTILYKEYFKSDLLIKILGITEYLKNDSTILMQLLYVFAKSCKENDLKMSYDEFITTFTPRDLVSMVAGDILDALVRTVEGVTSNDNATKNSKKKTKKKESNESN